MISLIALHRAAHHASRAAHTGRHATGHHATDPSVLSHADLVITGAGVALGLMTLVFGTTVLLRHDARSDRVWLTGFMAALVVVAAPLLLRDGDAGVVEPGLTALGAAYAVYALWAGARIFAGRRPFTAEGMTATLLVGLVAQTLLTHVANLGGVLMAALSLGLVAVAVEVWRGPMRTNLNAEILMFCCTLAGVAGIGVAVALRSRTWAAAAPGWSAPLALAAGITAVYFVAGLTLTGLRVERHGVWWAISKEHNLRGLGLLAPERFEADARDRIERTSRLGGNLTMLLVAIPDLPELNAAFGREAGDAALAFVASVLRDQLPPSALIGMLGGGTFGVVSSRPADVLVAALETGMLTASLPVSLGVRVSTSYGSSTAAECGYDFDSLRSRAREALDAYGLPSAGTSAWEERDD